MADAAGEGWSRRDFAGGAALLALVLGVPLAAVQLSDLERDHPPTERQRLLIREVSQLVLPRTSTPGAGEVGVGEFVVLALAHGLEGSRNPAAGAAMPALARFRRGDGSLNHLPWLEHELDRHGHGDFLSQRREEQARGLAALDAAAFSDGSGEHPWKTIKALILTGYYTSEVGATQELRYELVPGRWEPDLLLTPADRAWSSDWTAVEFG